MGLSLNSAYKYAGVDLISLSFPPLPFLHVLSCSLNISLLLNMTQQPAVYRLEAKTQSYDWGKLGDVSKVAHYAKQSGVDVDPAKPYAELWMGTHPNAPSVVMDDTRTPLKDLIQAHSELSTETIYNQYNGDLPFLFKILSIRKALSIQAHPDKALGARLHSEFPNIYKVCKKASIYLSGMI